MGISLLPLGNHATVQKLASTRNINFFLFYVAASALFLQKDTAFSSCEFLYVSARNTRFLILPRNLNKISILFSFRLQDFASKEVRY
jgi:hypothetical protein